ncbi:ribonuclease P subunit P30 [Methanobrevibacter sp. OttesenSCG-928-I08]|nr:ribonuclease P subunit P30 [Methanobrevibacter sp. OttesenSCG-928-I08]
MFYDLNIKGKNFNEDLHLAKEASLLGWNSVAFNYNDDNLDNAFEYFDTLQEESLNFNNPLNVDFRYEITTNNSNHLRKLSRKYRDKINLISVLGGHLKVNRTSCETIHIDILSRPYFKRKDCGINHVLAKEAANNDVAIELCFKDILTTYLSYRSKILANFKEIISLHRKFDFPLILTSGSTFIYDIKNPVDLSYFFKEIGLKEEEIEEGFKNSPKNLINFNKNRENLILKGVKKIDRFD